MSDADADPDPDPYLPRPRPPLDTGGQAAYARPGPTAPRMDVGKLPTISSMAAAIEQTRELFLIDRYPRASLQWVHLKPRLIKIERALFHQLRDDPNQDELFDLYLEIRSYLGMPYARVPFQPQPLFQPCPPEPIPMGLLAAASTLNTDSSKLTDDQSALVAAQQSVTTDTGNITSDDAAIVAALTAGPNPAFTGPAADGTVLVWTLDTTQPAGFSVVSVSPAT